MAGFFLKPLSLPEAPRFGFSLIAAVFVVGVAAGAVLSPEAEVEALQAIEPAAGVPQETSTEGPAARAEAEARASLSHERSSLSALFSRERREAGQLAEEARGLIGTNGRLSQESRELLALARQAREIERDEQEAPLELAYAAPSNLWALGETPPSSASLALPGAGTAALAALVPSAEPAKEAEPEAMAPALEPSPNPDEMLAWQHNAAKPTALRDWPKIAIVIDDLGNNRTRFRHVAALPSGLTLSFLTYALAIEELAEEARAAGHEVMLHVPMEPQGRSPAVPGLLTSELPVAELDRRIQGALSRLPRAAGINNHMGSRFTEDREKMRRVLSAVRSKGLYFLDSKTSPKSAGLSVARELGVPSIARDVFLDHEIDARAIRRQLKQLERVARERGYAVAIGHPHAATIEALREWLPTLPGKHLTITPLSDIIASQQTATQVASAQD